MKQSALIDIIVGSLFSEMYAANVNVYNTLFVFTADHSPGGKGSLYDLGLRVPLLMQWRAQIWPAQTIQQATSHIDLLPTLLHAATGSSYWLQQSASHFKTYPDDTSLSLLPTMSMKHHWGGSIDVFGKRHLYFEVYLDRAILDPVTGWKVHLRDSYCPECSKANTELRRLQGYKDDHEWKDKSFAMMEEDDDDTGTSLKQAKSCSNDLRTRWSASKLYDAWNNTVQIYNIIDDPAESAPSTDFKILPDLMQRKLGYFDTAPVILGVPPQP
jgi:hypothetical protein